MTNEEIFKRAIESWGTTAQINQALEECGEFIVAVNKLRRAKGADIAKRTDDLCGEIADVMNCMEQMSLLFGQGRVNEIRIQKMVRLEQRLQE